MIVARLSRTLLHVGPMATCTGGLDLRGNHTRYLPRPPRLGATPFHLPHSSGLSSAPASQVPDTHLDASQDTCIYLLSPLLRTPGLHLKMLRALNFPELSAAGGPLQLQLLLWLAPAARERCRNI